MSNQSELEQMLSKVSEMNKLVDRGNGDLEDTCYICGISPSKFLDYITANYVPNSEVEAREAEAYRQGYNDNAKNCYCDSPGATEGVIPHKHIMGDGESHDIRPDVQRIAELTKE